MDASVFILLVAILQPRGRVHARKGEEPMQGAGHPPPPAAHCCQAKTVGNVSYSLAGEGQVPDVCLDGCIYTRDSDRRQKFCFRSGSLPVECFSTGTPGTWTITPPTTTTTTTTTTTVTKAPCHPNGLFQSIPRVTRRRMARPSHCVCKPGFAGDGFCCLLDTDADGFPDNRNDSSCSLLVADNCPSLPNSGQEDADGDGVGDACDGDADGDGILNKQDNCPTVPNSDQKDTDVDQVGDVCDNCPTVKNPKQEDADSDGVGNACSQDADGDKVQDHTDNCPMVKNPGQEDGDTDGVGDACDNCRKVANPKQEDENNNLVGDLCDSPKDRDNDGVPDTVDNCPDTPNTDQLDGLPGSNTADGVGDACDNDDDNDGIPDSTDNCPLVPNQDQADSDGDGEGDACKDDCDQDQSNNSEDICPCDHTKSKTDFSTIVTHDVGISGQPVPQWEFTNEGKEINQKLNSRAGLAVGSDVFSNVRFTGTLFVNDRSDDDAVGFLFGYQNNKNFYTVTSSRSGSRQGYWKLTRVNSTTGHPSRELEGAIFRLGSSNDQSVAGQTTILWQHPTVGWKALTPYSWVVEQRSDSQTILLQISEGTTMIVDELIHDRDGLAGGRLGVYTHSQENCIWSRMETQCL